MSITELLLLFSLSAFSTNVFAKTPTIPLNCANIPGYKTEAERQYLSAASGGGDIYNINVTFIVKKPSKKLIDKALRECLDVAIKLDATKDILATAWHRIAVGNKPNDDDMLEPYDDLKFISYTASKKSVNINSRYKSATSSTL